MLKAFLGQVIMDAVTYTEHARRKTVTAMDVVYALKRQGRPIYGFCRANVTRATSKKRGKNRKELDREVHSTFIRKISEKYGTHVRSMLTKNELIARQFGEKYFFLLTSGRIIKFDEGREDNLRYEMLMQKIFSEKDFGPKIFAFKILKHGEINCLCLVMGLLQTVATDYFMEERCEDEI